MNCVDCGKETYANYGGTPLCTACREKREHAVLEEKSKSIQKASDFSQWRHRDLSELFWIHLGKYVKEPNAHSLSMMNMAYKWACHDNVGLANSFNNALKWAKIDLYTELEKWQKRKE